MITWAVLRVVATTRLVVTGQMIADLVILGLAIKAMARRTWSPPARTPKGLAAGSAWAAEDWFSGPWASIQNLQAYLHVLRRIDVGQALVRASAVHERDGRTYFMSCAQRAGHIPSWHGSCECYALWPVAAVSRWLLLLLLLLLSPLLSAAGAFAVSCALNVPMIGVGESAEPEGHL